MTNTKKIKESIKLIILSKALKNLGAEGGIQELIFLIKFNNYLKAYEYYLYNEFAKK